MKICPNCRKELTDGMKFCTRCGHRLDVAAPNTPVQKERDAFQFKRVIAVGLCVFVLAGAFGYFSRVRPKEEPEEIETESDESWDALEMDLMKAVEQDGQAEETIPSFEDQSAEAHWVYTDLGGAFYMPEGFRYVETGPSSQNVYLYENDDLEMYIQVAESYFIESDGTPQEQMLKDYQSFVKDLEDCITYHIAKDNFCTWSGFLDNGNAIFYDRLYNINNVVYVSVSFDYPTANREICDAILTEFLDDLSYA